MDTRPLRPDPPDAWKERGLCRWEDPDLWFPKRAEGATNHGVDGKAYCSRCPVQRQCLVTALVGNEKQGVWGGAGEPTRRRLGRMAREAGGLSPAGHPERCTCTFCIAVTEHFDALAVAYSGTGQLPCGEPDLVNHGTWQAFLHAGCRCGCCAQAYKASGRSPLRGPKGPTGPRRKAG